MPLPQIAQEDFAAGSVLAVARHLIPPNGCYRIVDGLLDDDGSVYRRGGSQYASGSALGTGGLVFVWDGYLPAVGRRTLFATTGKFGVLDTNDSTVIDLGNSGVPRPISPVVIGDFLYLPVAQKVYGGSRKASSYTTGTVTATNGWEVVTGSGTSWTANLDAGMIVSIANDTTRFYVIASVDSDTQFTLTEPFLGTTGPGQSYTAAPFGTVSTRGGRAADLYAVSAGRLLTLEGEYVRFSAGVDPTTGRLRPQIFDTTDNHRLPAGATGIAIVGLRDRALVFTTAGMWTVSNLAYDLTDAAGNVQQRLERVSELVAWGSAGIAAWENALVVPTVDGVFLVDGISRPTPVALSIAGKISEYARAGYRPGQATVYRNHYVLPIVDNTNVCIDTLVCRLDRPVDTRIGRIFPWTFMSGHGGEVRGVAVRVGQTTQSPVLLGAGADGRVLNLSSWFTPGAGFKNDADATTHDLIVETRDFRVNPAGARNRSTVRRVRISYELTDAASDDPVVQAFVGTGVDIGSDAAWGAVNWGSFEWGDSSLEDFTALAGQAPEAQLVTPYTWRVNRKSEWVRYRFQSSGPSSKMILRAVTSDVRRNEKTR